MPQHRQTSRYRHVLGILLGAVLLGGGVQVVAAFADEGSDGSSGSGGSGAAADPGTTAVEAAQDTAPATSVPAPRRSVARIDVLERDLAARKVRDKMRERRVDATMKRVLAAVSDGVVSPPPPPVDAQFRIGTYNVQGSQHKANGPGRASTSAGFILDRGIDVVGLQEVQRDQLPAMSNRMSGFEFWPRDALGRQGYRHQIAYRSSMFDFVDGGSVEYTFDSQRIPLPWIKLRHEATGGEFYLINAHNSARNLENERDSATAIQIALINQLRASGLPVFIVGDMNEHTEFFCKVSAGTGMVAANGGSYNGGCQLPPPPLRVDWIMGIGGDFSGYVQDGASISSGASDHYFLYADVSVEFAARTEEDEE